MSPGRVTGVIVELAVNGPEMTASVDELPQPSAKFRPGATAMVPAPFHSRGDVDRVHERGRGDLNDEDPAVDRVGNQRVVAAVVADSVRQRSPRQAGHVVLDRVGQPDSRRREDDGLVAAARRAEDGLGRGRSSHGGETRDEQ